MLGAFALWSVAAHGYAVETHRQVTLIGLERLGLDAPALPVPDDLPARIRADLDATARTSAVGPAWTARWATPEKLDGWELKQALLLAPARTVQGLDATALPAEVTTLRQVAGLGATEPDTDERNKDRLFYDAEHKPLSDKWGNPVPYDPAILNMGKLGALSSQAHAHYGLPNVEFSEDSKVLQEDPRRFAVQVGWKGAPILTLAPVMAQMHMDLAMLAALSDDPGGQTEAWRFAGQGMHYVEDVANPIHCVQVGLYDFFFDAGLEQLKMSIFTGGGYLGTLRSLPSIGMDILTNHHTLSEELTRKRLLEAVEGKDSPEGKRLMAALAEDDAALAAMLDAALSNHPADPAKVITETLIDVGSYDGDDLYRATRAIALPKWRKEGVLFDYDHDHPDAAVLPPSAENAADYEAFWKLQETSFRRAGTAIRKYARLLQELPADPAERAGLKVEVQTRLATRQSKLLDEADARRVKYLEDPPQPSSAPEHAPAILAAEVGAFLLFDAIILAIVLWRRRRSP